MVVFTAYIAYNNLPICDICVWVGSPSTSRSPASPFLHCQRIFFITSGIMKAIKVQKAIHVNIIMINMKNGTIPH